MLIATVLVLVAASALRPFELKQGFHELSALLTGTLILGWQLGGGLAGPKLGFNGSIILDPTTLLGAGVLVGSAMVVSQTWANDAPSALILSILAAASALLLSAQTSALALASLELQSYSTYIILTMGGLDAYRQAGTSTYLVVGALATAAFVIGWAVLFQLGELALARLPAEGLLGQVCQISGIITKIGCFPFGFWLPTAYGGMAWATLGTVAVLPATPLAAQVWILAPAGLPGVYLLAGVSVAVGGVLSSSTPHTRSLLAFSGMAHAGYLLSGAAFTLYPIFLYSFAYSVAFTLLCRNFAPSNLRLSSLRGHLNLFPLQAGSLQAGSFSLGGIPPLLGFFGKSYILLGGICLSNSIAQPLLLAVLGAVGMVAYLRLSLAAVGYPQTYSHLVQPQGGSHSSGGPQALLLASVLTAGLLSGDLAITLLA